MSGRLTDVEINAVVAAISIPLNDEGINRAIADAAHAKAIAWERERCAKVCENCAPIDGCRCAAAIREGAKPTFSEKVAAMEKAFAGKSLINGGSKL